MQLYLLWNIYIYHAIFFITMDRFFLELHIVLISMTRQTTS